MYHIGLVAPNITKFVEKFRTLGLHKITHPEPDPIQEVAACFVAAGDGQDVCIELLESIIEHSPVTNFLEKHGGVLHHTCFEVDGIARVAEVLSKKGLRMVSPPVECVGYDRSFNLGDTRPTRIDFFLLADKILIELLQKGV